MSQFQLTFNRDTTVSSMYNMGNNVGFNSLLCTSALIAVGQLPRNATVEEGSEYFEQLLHGDCSQCKAVRCCVICKFEE